MFAPFLCCSTGVKNSTTRKNVKLGPTTSIRGNLIRNYDHEIEEDYFLDRDHELGKGGCGVVVIGEHKETHAQYAIKIVNKATAERGRLDREIKLLKDVDHANIVRLFSVYDTPSNMYFVMELCLGGHLGNLISRQPGKFLPEDWAKKLCKQILSAVAHIHSRGIAHRDIKLQNILIDNTNEHHAQIKLIDFGYGSRYVGALPMRTKCGTPYTTAPEVLRECYDERCDVWSVGVVLYIMLCGRRPFEAVDAGNALAEAGKATMITNILAGRYHFNHKAWAQVSRAGINFVKTLLHQDYKTRIHSSEALDHPWLRDSPLSNSISVSSPSSANNSPSKPAPAGFSILATKTNRAIDQLKKSVDNNDLQRTGMLALVFGIPSKILSDLRTVFQSFDLDASGTLSKEEFQAALQKIGGPSLTLDDINKLFETVDIDKNEQISFTEFLVATLDPRDVDIEEFGKAFKLLDEDGNGFISKDELRKVLKVQVEHALENQDDIPEIQKHNYLSDIDRKVDIIFEQVDVNHDGRISQGEFLWAMTGLDAEMARSNSNVSAVMTSRSRSERQLHSNANSEKSASNRPKKSPGKTKAKSFHSSVIIDPAINLDEPLHPHFHEPTTHDELAKPLSPKHRNMSNEFKTVMFHKIEEPDSKSNPTSRPTTPPNYRGILAQNKRLEHLNNTIEEMPSRDSKEKPSDGSSSSFDSEKVASLFGPAQQAPLKSPSPTPMQSNANTSPLAPLTRMLSKNRGLERANSYKSQNWENEERELQLEGDMVDDKRFVKSDKVNPFVKSPSFRTSTIIDNPANGSTIKIVPTSDVFSPPVSSRPVPIASSRAPSFKRDISSKFLDIERLDHKEEHVDPEPVSNLPPLSRGMSKRVIAINNKS